MNICLVNQWYLPEDWGGVPVSIYQLAQGLKSQGHEVTVVTSTNHQSLINTTVEEDGIRVIRMTRKSPLIRFKQAHLFYYNLNLAFKLKTILERYKIHIVEYADVNGEAFFHRFFHKIPYVVRLQTPLFIAKKFYSEKESKNNLELLYRMEKKAIMRASGLISPSRSMAEWIGAECKIKPKIISIIRNPLRPIVNEQQSDNEGLFKFPLNTVLYFGRLEKRKGAFVFASAIPIIFKNFPEAFFVFAGPDRSSPSGGSTEMEIKQYLHDQNIPEQRIRFLGMVERKRLFNCYREASIVVVPSLYEDYPYSVIEPMSIGAAVVTSDCYGIPEIVTHGENGLLSKTGDSHDLAMQILELLKAPSQIERIGKEAKVFIATECSAQKIADETTRFYQKILEKERGIFD